MGITDKTRKVLWGRSGSLCAFCKTHLVIDASSVDAEAVVGDECHIVSAAANGPRHGHRHTQDTIDSIDNLILLCRVHHKLVDDQPDTFTADTLRQLKTNHERWVKEKLSRPNHPEPVHIARSLPEIPAHLLHISSAKLLLDLAADCHGRYDDYPDDLSEADLEHVGAFLQNLTDCIDIGLNEPQERISAQKCINESMKELEAAGLRVYAAREKQQLRGGTMQPSAFHAMHLRIVRHDDPSQVALSSARNK